MKKVGIGIVVLLALLVLCLPVSSLAKPPYRVQILGVYYESGDNPSIKAINVVPVNNNTFGIYSNDQLELCTRLYLYFRAGTNGISNFNIQIKLLSEGYQLNTSANNVAYSRLNNVNSSGVITDSISVGSNLKQTYDDNTITWQYIRDSVIDRNGILLVLTFQNFMLGSSPVYFEVLNFSVNGIPVEEIAVTETNEGFSEDISSLSQSENEWWQRVVVPDYDAYLDDPYIIDGSTDYRLAIREISFNNFLVPGMITLVFIMAFYGFLLYGKKG